MIVKVIALGFVIGKESYLRNSWNVMDGLLVIISIVDVALTIHINLTIKSSSDTPPKMLGFIRVFRLLRTLRALTGMIKKSVDISN